MPKRKRLTADDVANLNQRPIWKRSPKHRNAQGQRAAIKPRAPSETAECRTFIAWTKLVLFEGEPLFERVVKIPNERGKAGVQTAILTDIGMRAGFPDYDLLTPAGKFHGLYLEAKKVSGGVTDAEQIVWRDKLRRWNYHAEICEGAISLIGAVKSYMDMTGATACGQFVDTTRIAA